MPRIHLPKDWPYRAKRALRRLGSRKIVAACFWCGQGMHTVTVNTARRRKTPTCSSASNSPKTASSKSESANA